MTRLSHKGILVFVALGLVIPALAQDRREVIAKCRELLKTSIQDYHAASYPEALENLDTLLEIDSKNADGYYWKGKVQLALGDTSRAIESLSTGTQAAPLSSRLKILLARIYLDQGNADDATALISSVLAIKPHQGEALYLRGLLFLSHGDTTSALDDWAHSIEYAERRDR